MGCSLLFEVNLSFLLYRDKQAKTQSKQTYKQSDRKEKTRSHAKGGKTRTFLLLIGRNTLRCK